MTMWTSRKLGALLLGVGMGLVLGRFSPWLGLLAPFALMAAGVMLWRRAAEPLPLLFVLALSLALLVPTQRGGHERFEGRAPVRTQDRDLIARVQNSDEEARAWRELQRLVVVNSTGDVTIEGGQLEPKVTVSYRHNRQDRPRRGVPDMVQAHYQGGTLTIVGLDPRGPLEARYALRADIVIRVPHEVRVEVTSGVGAVRVTDVAEVQVQSGVGDVYAARSPGGALVRSGVGTVSLEDIAGGLDAKTRVGEIALTYNQPLNASLVAETEVGNVSLSVPRDSNVTIRALSEVRKFSGELERVTAGERRLRLGLGQYPVELRAHVGEVAVRAR